MSHFATIDRTKSMSAILKVIGVGGGGCNAVESMIRRSLNGVEYVAINTDAQVLDVNSAQYKIQVGTKITKGLGAGADPNVGKKAVEEDREKIAEVIQGSDMVFVTAGMGGGTGTGGAPVVASIAKSLGALVVGIVTKPFKWEGKQRMLNAENGIQELKQYVDSLIVIPNERILSILVKETPFTTAFDAPNEVLYEATRGIADIITIKGLVNVDFADVRAVMNQSGDAMMGCGIASGENRAIEAAQKAISSPLLEGLSIKGAKSVLINVTGSSNLTLREITEGNNIIQEAAGEEANVIFGCVKKEEMNDYISYTVIATGFNNGKKNFKEKIAVQPEAKKPVKPVDAGFMFKDQTENVDKDNLDTPTIFRVKPPKAAVDNEEDSLPSTGFNFNRFKSFASEEKSKEEVKSVFKQHDDDEDDSSAFLKMIMD